ncbi:MAG: hypothetical protein WB609_06725 [Candidatus Cybelea sp.]
MKTLSAADQLYLAGELGQLADCLDAYANDPKCGPEDAAKLRDSADRIRRVGQQINDDGALAAFADASAAFAKLSDITQKANEAAHDLAKERAAIAHFTSLATAAVSFGLALAKGGDVWGAASKLLAAIQDSNKATLGSGARKHKHP